MIGGFEITIKTLTGKTFPLYLEDSNVTIDRVKGMITEKDGIQEGEMRLIYRGTEMKNNHRLADHNVQRDATIHLILKRHEHGHGGMICNVM